jgi:phosphate uptake regulator
LTLTSLRWPKAALPFVDQEGINSDRGPDCEADERVSKHSKLLRHEAALCSFRELDYRSQRRKEAKIDDEVEAIIAGRQPSALSLLEAMDTERVVRQILNQLPERDRRLLHWVLLEDATKMRFVPRLASPASI